MTHTAFLFKKPRVDVSVKTSGNQKSEFYQRYWANLPPLFSYCRLFKARLHLNFPLQRSWIISDVQAFCPMPFLAPSHLLIILYVWIKAREDSCFQGSYPFLKHFKGPFNVFHDLNLAFCLQKKRWSGSSLWLINVLFLRFSITEKATVKSISYKPL